MSTPTHGRVRRTACLSLQLVAASWQLVIESRGHSSRQEDIRQSVGVASKRRQSVDRREEFVTALAGAAEKSYHRA